MPKIIDLDVNVVGLTYRTSKDLRKVLMGRTFPVDLVREPENPKDDNAIKVVMSKEKYGVIAGKHLGYIRRLSAETLAPMFDTGQIHVVKATMSGVHAESDDADLALKLRKA